MLVLNIAYIKFLYFGLLSIDIFDILFLLNITFSISYIILIENIIPCISMAR